MTTQPPIHRRTLLHVDSSLRGSPTSVSRRLGAAFITAWLEANPAGVVLHRDLGADPVPHQDEEGWLAGVVPPDFQTEAQRAAAAFNEPLIAELEAADEYLLTVPMYNLTVPSSFKAWLDRVIVVGRTLMLDGSPAPLGGRRATVLGARGGGYAGTERVVLDHHEPYLRTILGMLGMVDVEVVNAELTLAGVDPLLAGMEPHRDASMTEALRRADARGRSMGARVPA